MYRYCTIYPSNPDEPFDQSNLLLNNYFQKVDRWDKFAIEDRAKALADVCIEIWPCFASNNPISSPDDVTGTKPTKLMIAGDDYYVNSWKEVYIEVLKWIQENFPDSFAEISNEFPSYITDLRHNLRRPQDLENGYFAEINLSSESIYRFCEQVMRLDKIKELCNPWSVER